MMITRENLIGLLNLDLELEAAGAVQYINHAAMLTGSACGDLIRTLKIFTYAKIEHAMLLAEQVAYFGGLPSARVGRVHTSNDNEEMLWVDFEDEEDAVRRYKIRIEQAEQLNEIELSEGLRGILRAEQQQAMYLKKQVCVRVREDEGPDIDLASPDARDFSHVWAERAMKVPLRLKKQQ